MTDPACFPPAASVRGRAGWRGLVAAGLLAAAAVLAPELAVAQGVDFGACLRTEIDAGPMGPGGALDPSDPGTIGVMVPPTSMVGAARVCAEQASAAIFLAPDGLAWVLFYSFALIIVVWTGLQIMFGGQFGIGEVVNLAMLIGFPFAILTWYAVPAPLEVWGQFTFTDMVTTGATTIARDLIDGAFTAFASQVAETFGNVWEYLFLVDAAERVQEVASEGDGGEGGGFVNWLDSQTGGAVSAGAAMLSSASNAVSVVTDPWGFVVRLFNMILSFVLMGIMLLVFVLLIIIPAVVAYGSYLWGHVALLAAVFLGPIFVPFVMIPQLSFLFWGWFKSLLGAAVHTMVAAAVFVTVSQMLLMPLHRFRTMAMEGVRLDDGDVASPLAALAGWFFETIPLVLIAMLGAFKIGEITSMIMNAGPMPSSGLGDRLRGAQQMRGMASGARGALAGGRGALAARGAAGAAGAAGGAAAAATGVGAVVAAGAVLSQATQSK